MGGNLSSWVLNLFFIPNHLVGGSTWIVCPRKQKPHLLVDQAKDLGERLHLGSSGRKDSSENDLLGGDPRTHESGEGEVRQIREGNQYKGCVRKWVTTLGSCGLATLARLGPAQKMHLRVTPRRHQEVCIVPQLSVIICWCFSEVLISQSFQPNSKGKVGSGDHREPSGRDRWQ